MAEMDSDGFVTVASVFDYAFYHTTLHAKRHSRKQTPQEIPQLEIDIRLFRPSINRDYGPFDTDSRNQLSPIGIVPFRYLGMSAINEIIRYGAREFPKRCLDAYDPAISNRFVRYENGIVRDNIRKLEWRIADSSMSYEALKKEQEEKWRLPTVEELFSLVTDYSINGVFLDPAVFSFPNMDVARVWTSRETFGGFKAFQVDFHGRRLLNVVNSESGFVFWVRPI